MLKIFSLFLFFVIACNGYSQTYVDSLLQDLKSKTKGERIDSSALNTLERLADYYHLDNPVKSLEFSNKYLTTARNYNDKKSIAHAYHFLGDYYRDEGLPVIAIDYYFSSMYLYEELNFPGAIAYTNIDIGNIYFDLKKLDVAKDYYEKVISMQDEKDVTIAKAVALNNIGLIFREKKEYRQALDKFEEALIIRQKVNDKNLIAHSYNYIALIYTKLSEFTNAEKYFNLSVDLYKELKDYSNLGKVMSNIGNLYYDMGAKEKSLKTKNEAVDLFLKNNKLFAAADAMTNLAEFHLNEGSIVDGLKHAFKAFEISTQNKFTSLKQGSLKLISDLYYKENNTNDAYKYLKIYNELKDSISQQEAQRKIVNLEFSNELKRRDQEMNLMKAENKVKELDIENQKKRNTYLLIIIIVILILLLVIFFAFRIQRKTLNILRERNRIIDDTNKKLELSFAMLEEAKEEAEKNARIKSEFLSIMSHELRTPMNAVLGMTQVIMEENPRKDQLENLETIKISAESLLQIINDILDYNRLETGRLVLENKDFSLKNLMDKMFRIFTLSIKKKGLILKYNYDENLGESFIGDEIRISEILTNLIGNAIKFTEKGSVTVDIKKIGLKANSSLIRFSVIDTGIGISQESIANIFDSFTQEKTDTTRKYGGTGLGLSIVKKLLELMGGKIYVESRAGEGSKFYFEIELQNSEKLFEPVIAETKPQPILEKLNKKVLIVEDNKVNQLVMTKMLRSTGIEIDIADNGKIGFEKVLQNDYDIVFMDLLMPEMDGYEAAKEIRNCNKEIPIIALTADVMKGVQEKTKDAGMNSYLTKPVKKDELLKILDEFTKKEN